MKPTPPDVIAAIGEPKTPRPRLTDAEMGFQMKMLARRLIENGEVKSVVDAENRLRIRANWFIEMDYLDEDTRLYWIKMEKKCYMSLCKIFKEMRRKC